jgi:hypothetical protein
MDELKLNRASVGDLARKVRSALGAALMTIALAACGGGGDSPAAGGASGGHASSVAADGGAVPTDRAAGGGSGSARGSVPGVSSAPGATTLSWIPPTMNEDGTPLKLTGYRIYWGQTEDYFPDAITLTNPGLTRYVVEQLAPATWYFVATALSEKGESEFSNVLAMQVR